jgi:hypothetical protein
LAYASSIEFSWYHHPFEADDMPVRYSSITILAYQLLSSTFQYLKHKTTTARIYNTVVNICDIGIETFPKHT